jgi:hypothetical protein
MSEFIFMRKKTKKMEPAILAMRAPQAVLWLVAGVTLYQVDWQGECVGRLLDRSRQPEQGESETETPDSASDWQLAVPCCVGR